MMRKIHSLPLTNCGDVMSGITLRVGRSRSHANPTQIDPLSCWPRGWKPENPLWISQVLHHKSLSPRRQTRLKCSGTSVPQRFIDWDRPIPDSLCQRFSTGQFHDAALHAEHAQMGCVRSRKPRDQNANVMRSRSIRHRLSSPLATTPPYVI